MCRLSAVLIVVAVAGCGPSAQENQDRKLREETLSILNIEADRWEGGEDFTTPAVDAYGKALSASIEKGPINHTLEVRSSGSDGLFKNSDDIAVTRIKPHGESSISKETGKVAESLAEGLGSGVIKGTIRGLKEGLTGGGSSDEKK